MDKVLEIEEIKASVAKIAPSYGIKKATLFGSYASGKKTSASDIDLLVEFGPRPVSIYKVAGFKVEMEEVTGKAVDIVPLPVSENSLLEIEREVLLYAE